MSDPTVFRPYIGCYCFLDNNGILNIYANSIVVKMERSGGKPHGRFLGTEFIDGRIKLLVQVDSSGLVFRHESDYSNIIGTK